MIVDAVGVEDLHVEAIAGVDVAGVGGRVEVLLAAVDKQPAIVVEHLLGAGFALEAIMLGAGQLDQIEQSFCRFLEGGF